MDLRKTLETFSNKESKSRKEGFAGDAAQYAFFRHTLKLLSKIAKQDIETEYPPQVDGVQRFECKKCQGTGFIELWDGGDETHNEDKIIEDCDICKGEGFLNLNVIDKRKKSKNKTLEYDDKY